MAYGARLESGLGQQPSGVRIPYPPPHPVEPGRRCPGSTRTTTDAAPVFRRRHRGATNAGAGDAGAALVARPGADLGRLRSRRRGTPVRRRPGPRTGRPRPALRGDPRGQREPARPRCEHPAGHGTRHGWPGVHPRRAHRRLGPRGRPARERARAPAARDRGRGPARLPVRRLRTRDPRPDRAGRRTRRACAIGRAITRISGAT